MEHEKALHGFVDIAKILQESQVGNCVLHKYTVTEREAKQFNWMCLIHGKSYDVISPGEYIRLMVGDDVMMADTPMERLTSRCVLYGAKGNVFIAGLGLGMIPETLHERMNEEADGSVINSVTVVENNTNVIELVWPQLSCSNDSRFSLVVADARTYIPHRSKRFDYAFLDIWPDICGDNYEEMKQMKRHYRKYMVKKGLIDVWRMDDTQELVKRERKFYGG